MAGVAVFVAIVSALHVVQRQYDPVNQLMSELALGSHGGMMLFAFGAIALSMAGVESALASLGAAPALQTLIVLAAAAFLSAGLFPLGATSLAHIGAISAAFVITVLAMYLFPALGGPMARFAPRRLSWTCAVGVAASVALGHSMLPMGIAQRAAALFLLAWIAAVGWRLARA